MAHQGFSTVVEQCFDVGHSLATLSEDVSSVDVSTIGAEPVAAIIQSAIVSVVDRTPSTGKQLSQGALDICWEKLNSGYWRDVSVLWRQLYTYSSISMALSLAAEGLLKESLKTCDVGLLMGAPVPGNHLHRLAAILTNRLRETSVSDSLPNDKLPCGPDFQCGGLPIERVQCPSLLMFEEKYMRQKVPVIITDATNHWPALSSRPWSLAYLKQAAGDRTVPIEVGARYTDQTWSQALMTINSFIDSISEAPSEEVAGKSSTHYLAQHQLFEQLPELRSDICVPDYCCLSESDDTEPVVNAWIGPCGTVSPLHHDPYHNVFAQVVGKKLIRLYSSAHSDLLYPHDSAMMHNTSQVDCENPDLQRFPKFAEAPFWECVVQPGDLLYIPPKFWHYVRSLSVSFSVSFWWT
eukprot:scpid59953/ scgid15126/ Lysine-specific demethylase 8; JmjC domain-containing protein 5; Jumonji domain-containing protein 5